MIIAAILVALVALVAVWARLAYPHVVDAVHAFWAQTTPDPELPGSYTVKRGLSESPLRPDDWGRTATGDSLSPTADPRDAAPDRGREAVSSTKGTDPSATC